MRMRNKRDVFIDPLNLEVSTLIFVPQPWNDLTIQIDSFLASSVVYFDQCLDAAHPKSFLKWLKDVLDNFYFKI